MLKKAILPVIGLLVGVLLAPALAETGATNKQDTVSVSTSAPPTTASSPAASTAGAPAPVRPTAATPAQAPAAATAGPAVVADHLPYQPGEVFAGVGMGKIKRFTPTGSLIEILDTTGGSHFQTGMCFDASSNLRSTNFSSNNMTLFDKQGAVAQHPWGTGFNSAPESCVVDAAGDVFVGQADGSADVLKFNPAGQLLASYDVATTRRGSDWVDLAADQRTLLYTSEGSEVKRFDVAANTQLADFATALPSPCFALRIRSNGEVLVACASAVQRLGPDGAVIQTYPAAGYGLSYLFALNQDPDGTSFWTADIRTGDIVRVDIATGNQLTKFNADKFTDLGGLAIFGEITASQPVSLKLNPAEGNEGEWIPLVANFTGAQPTVTWSAVPGPGVDPGATCTFADSPSGSQALISRIGGALPSGAPKGLVDALGALVGTLFPAPPPVEPDPGTIKTFIMCTDDGPFIVTASFGAGDAPSKTTSAEVTVRNVPPTVAIDAPATRTQIPLGQAVEATVVYSDPGANDTHTCRIDWGDGAASEGVILAAAGSGICKASHTYGALGEYVITAYVIDDDTTSGTPARALAMSVAPGDAPPTTLAPPVGTVPLVGTASPTDVRTPGVPVAVSEAMKEIERLLAESANRSRAPRP